ncbi:MAG TPA: 4-hydroxythreonine-4-phosphate dehydrogenase PdxA [Steroidobacteraceae bacterium]|nr:4-hydroxythreonine-4-phosphate dehydrogenase PdxA [Steroidobacteraceae bacterium]
MSTRPKARRPAAALRTIAVTAGEPAGIGPDICSTLLEDPPPACRVVLIGDVSLFGRSRLKRAPKPRIPLFDATTEPRAGLQLLHVPLAAPCVPGTLDPANARYVLDTLDAAIGGCAAGAFHAIVTAPVQKSVINEAGIPFTGHTEYLARQTGVRLPVMMLVGGGMRVALMTTHLPLKKVSAAITPARLESVLRIVESDLRTMFGIRKPRLLVLGLNPHAGESGHLGREEIETIAPALAALRASGLDLTGPVPADTAFLPRKLDGFDAVVAMFHDQGLPVLKHASFGHAVNVTLGLPIVRTSVDHGTALDLAGTRKADTGSLRAAFDLALDLSGRVHAQTSHW